MPRGTSFTSAKYSDLLKIIFGLQSNQSDVDCCHQVYFCNMTMQSLTLPVQQLQQSQSCILIVFLIHHTHKTLLQVISICLDHSKKQWVERRSVLMKRYATRCMSGCADYQKNFFSKGIYALCKRWRTCIDRGEIMLKSDTALYHFCTINSI